MRHKNERRSKYEIAGLTSLTSLTSCPRAGKRSPLGFRRLRQQPGSSLNSNLLYLESLDLTLPTRYDDLKEASSITCPCGQLTFQVRISSSKRIAAENYTAHLQRRPMIGPPSGLDFEAPHCASKQYIHVAVAISGDYTSI